MKTLTQLKVLALIAIIGGLGGLADSVYIYDYKVVRILWDSVFFIILQLVCAWAILSFKPSGFREIPFVGAIFISSIFVLFSASMLISGLHAWQDDIQGAIYLAGSLIFYSLVIVLSVMHKRQLRRIQK